MYNMPVQRIIAQETRNKPTFQPSLLELERHLKTNPKQFPKKQGKLSKCRAASLVRYDGVAWRMVFTLDEKERIVYVLALGTHDKAYSAAEKRV